MAKINWRRVILGGLLVVLAHRLHLGRSRPNAAILRANAQTGGGLAEK
jgi:hypothetical protein